jgi:pSer/pThr/pTyr-binding forkhead associated (FHA) protein
VVLHPSGQRSRSSIDALPFLIGRQPDNHLVLRDNRASRMQARIVAGNGSYVLEDLDSRHGTWVNGNRIARHVLRNSDRIDLGVPESYQLTFALESGGIHRILGQLSATPKSGGMGDNNLAKLRSLMEVARALQNSLSTQEVLTAVVDAALAVTGCERGFLLLRKGDALEVSVSRDLEGKTLEADDLRVPTAVIRARRNRRKDWIAAWPRWSCGEWCACRWCWCRADPWKRLAWRRTRSRPWGCCISILAYRRRTCRPGIARSCRRWPSRLPRF